MSATSHAIFLAQEGQNHVHRGEAVKFLFQSILLYVYTISQTVIMDPPPCELLSYLLADASQHHSAVCPHKLQITDSQLSRSNSIQLHVVFCRVKSCSAGCDVTYARPGRTWVSWVALSPIGKPGMEPCPLPPCVRVSHNQSCLLTS